MVQTMRVSLVPFLGLFASIAACGGAPRASEAPTPPMSPAVEARIASLPTPPIAWSRPISSLDENDFRSICPYLADHVGLSSSAVTCPDGRVVETYAYDCEPGSSAEHARSHPCSLSFGEVVACYVAVREHPCDSGPLGEGLAECEALDACTFGREASAEGGAS